MGTLRLAATSLFALGIAIIMFESLVFDNNANFHPCPADLFCDYFHVPPEVYFGIFPAIAGAIMLGLSEVMRQRRIRGSGQ